MHKSKALNDSHFKSFDRQRIHRLINFCEEHLFLFCGTAASFCGAYLVHFTGSWYATALTLLCLPAYIGYCDERLIQDKYPFLLWLVFIEIFLCIPLFLPILTFVPAMLFLGTISILNTFLMLLFYFPINYILEITSNIIYLPPSCANNSKKEIVLIDFDGNPEMCKTIDMGMYPALSGYYGYRLPNAGDLHKITEYLESNS